MAVFLLRLINFALFGGGIGFFFFFWTYTGIRGVGVVHNEKRHNRNKDNDRPLCLGRDNKRGRNFYIIQLQL